jgi:hypothetical protein
MAPEALGKHVRREHFESASTERELRRKTPVPTSN